MSTSSTSLASPSTRRLGLRPVEIAPNVLSESVGDEAVVLDLRSGHYYGLNPTGTRIWQLLQEHSGLDEILCLLLEEFEVSEEVLRGDLSRFVQDLASRGIVKHVIA